jgi:hypothetical protein
VRRTVSAPDGTRWKVGRRWLVWRPRLRGIRRAGELTAHGTHGIDLASDVPVLLVLLLLPLTVVVAAFLAEWLVLLAAVPLAALARFWAGWPWEVAAWHPRGDRDHRNPHVARGTAPGAHDRPANPGPGLDIERRARDSNPG